MKKKKVEEASNISAELQRLIYAGQVLRDDAPLSQYGIQSGHTLHMVARAANAGRADQSQPQPQPQQQQQQQQQQQPQQPQPQQQQPQPQPQQQIPQFNPQMFNNMFQQGQGQAFQGLDVNTMMGLLNNPMVQQSMNQLLQNPAMLQQMLQNNPMANQLMQNNPIVAHMLQNPDVLRQMANPQLLNQVLQAQGMQGQAGQQQPGQQQMPNIDFAQLFGAMGGIGGMGQGMGGMGGGMGQGMGGMGQGFNMPQQQQQGGPQQSPEERFTIQLQQLQDMGFNNRQVNIQALTVTNGNVDAAVERILMG